MAKQTLGSLFAVVLLLNGCGGDGSDTGDSSDPDNPDNPLNPNDPGLADTPVPGFACAGEGNQNPLGPGADITCFYGPDATTPAASVDYVLEEFDSTQAVHIRLTFDPDFVDNSYGDTAIGWTDTKKGVHEFKQLVGSDHAELLVRDGNGDIAMHFALDYITEDPSAPSGYSSLGIAGGDGQLMVGSADDILAVTTSLDRNLNERGYGSYTTNSPPTDDACTPSAEAPDWDYRVVYEVWIRASAFGAAGYGESYIEYVHASPAKDKQSTIIVEPSPCPPDNCWEIDPGDCSEQTPPTSEDGTPCDDTTNCPDGEFCGVEGYCRTPLPPVQ